MRSLRMILLSLQLVIALPLLWWGLFPRLGPVEWATFILLAGVLANYVAPVLAAADAWWAIRARRSGRRVYTPALLAAAVWGAIAVMGWTGLAITPLRTQFAEVPTRVATALRCMPTRVKWYERGAEVYCRRTRRSGEREMLRVFASNGPFPWSRWRIDVAAHEPAPETGGPPMPHAS